MNDVRARSGRALRAVLVGVVALCAACGASTIGADAASDAGIDARTAPCRWRAGTAVSVPTTQGASATLLALAGTPEGAWLAYRESRSAGGGDGVHVVRLGNDGRALDGATTRPSLGVIASGTEARASFSLGAQSEQRALFVSDAMGGCAMARLDASAQPTGATVQVTGTRDESFPTGGCRDALPVAAGHSFLGEQVRALWGVSWLTVDASGGFRAGRGIAFTNGVPVPYARFALGADRFALMSTHAVTDGGTRLEISLHSREDGNPIGTMNTVRASSYPMHGFRAVAFARGIFAAWEEDTDRLPVVPGLTTRVLDASGAPVEPERFRTELGFYRGGLAATEAFGDVLVSAGFVGDSARHLVLVVGPDGADRGAPIELGTDEPASAELVSTREGALLVYNPRVSAGEPSRLTALPLRCE